MSEKDNMNHNELENEVEKVDDKDVVVEDQKKDDDEYEKVCFICHRPESQTGKMMDLPNNISVCPDCGCIRIDHPRYLVFEVNNHNWHTILLISLWQLRYN